MYEKWTSSLVVFVFTATVNLTAIALILFMITSVQFWSPNLINELVQQGFVDAGSDVFDTEQVTLWVLILFMFGLVWDIVTEMIKVRKSIKKTAIWKKWIKAVCGILMKKRVVFTVVGVEINMIVTDSLRALELYEKIFEIERVEVTDFSKGEKEVIFSLYGVRFHMLDENPEFGLKAPGGDDSKTISFNVMVPDIKETFSKAISHGCTEMQAVTDLPDFGVSNAIFVDPFGYVWLLHQVHKEVSFEERMRLFEKKREN